MSYPPGGIDAKLGRADEHFKAIQGAVQGFIGPNPDRLPGEFNPQVGHYVFRAERDSRSADWISPIVGDFVHNARTALDYLTCELVLAAGNEITGKTAFPIFTDPDKYRTDSPKQIAGVPTDAVAIFEELQPFYGPNSNPFDPAWRDAEQEPLAYLYALDNRDKHRALNLTEVFASARFDGLESGLRDGVYTYIDDEPAIFPVGAFKAGAIIASLTGYQPGMNVHLVTAFDVAFDREGPAPAKKVVETLDRIRKVVRGRVLPAFERFFV